MFLTCLITKNEETTGILINFINDVITMDFYSFFEDFCFCCYSFLNFLLKIFCIYYCAKSDDSIVCGVIVTRIT